MKPSFLITGAVTGALTYLASKYGEFTWGKKALVPIMPEFKVGLQEKEMSVTISWKFPEGYPTPTEEEMLATQRMLQSSVDSIMRDAFEGRITDIDSIKNRMNQEMDFVDLAYRAGQTT